MRDHIHRRGGHTCPQCLRNLRGPLNRAVCLARGRQDGELAHADVESALCLETAQYGPAGARVQRRVQRNSPGTFLRCTEGRRQRDFGSISAGRSGMRPP
jgi:hypothetical protein